MFAYQFKTIWRDTINKSVIVSLISFNRCIEIFFFFFHFETQWLNNWLNETKRKMSAIFCLFLMLSYLQLKTIIHLYAQCFSISFSMLYARKQLHNFYVYILFFFFIFFFKISFQAIKLTTDHRQTICREAKTKIILIIILFFLFMCSLSLICNLRKNRIQSSQSTYNCHVQQHYSTRCISSWWKK